MLTPRYTFYVTTLVCVFFAPPALSESSSLKPLRDEEIEERCTELVIGSEVRHDPIKMAIITLLMNEGQRRLISECSANLKATFTNIESDNNYFGKVLSDNKYRSESQPQDHRFHWNPENNASEEVTQYISISSSDDFSGQESERPLRGYSVMGRNSN